MTKKPYYKKVLEERSKRREGNMTPAEVKKANEEYFKKHPGRKKESEAAEKNRGQVYYPPPPGGTGSPSYPGKRTKA